MWVAIQEERSAKGWALSEEVEWNLNKMELRLNWIYHSPFSSFEFYYYFLNATKVFQPLLRLHPFPGTAHDVGLGNIVQRRPGLLCNPNKEEEAFITNPEEKSQYTLNDKLLHNTSYQ